MYFEIDEFLATLYGLTREQTTKMITVQQDKLMLEVSKPNRLREGTVVFRSFKSEISFLNNLGNEIGSGLISPSTTLERLRIDTVINNLSQLN